MTMTIDSPVRATDVRRLLAEAARNLADSGESGETVLAGDGLNPTLMQGLADLMRPEPGAAGGYRVVPNLLGGDLLDPGPTPLRWEEAGLEADAVTDIALVLAASALGDVFGWENQQAGRLVHNIVPSPGCEEMQIGASSVAALTWHTEDAFHPDRADYLMLACLRNDEGIGTKVATVGSLGLSDSELDVLSGPGAVILPDASYGAPDACGPGPEGMATVWSRDGSPCLRYDPEYTRLVTRDPEFLAAYEELGRRIDERGVAVPLSPGDVVVIDNDRAVHGRAPFRARFDGTDRWLKRVLVRSPRPRPSAESRESGFGQRQVSAGEGRVLPRVGGLDR